MLPICATRGITVNPSIFANTKLWLTRKSVGTARNFYQQLLIPLAVNSSSSTHTCCRHSTNYLERNIAFPARLRLSDASYATNVYIYSGPAQSMSTCCGGSDAIRYYGTKAGHRSSSKLLVKSSQSELTDKFLIDKDEWQTLYRFKYIALAAVIQRIKIYQSLFTCCLILPGSLGMFLHGAASYGSLMFAVFSSVLASGMLYVMGTFCSRLIGILYVSKKDDTLIRVAHLNFWGRREDQYFLKTDIIPFSELPDKVSDVYIKLRFYSEMDRTMNLSLRYGHVYNEEEFQNIFGSSYMTK